MENHVVRQAAVDDARGIAMVRVRTWQAAYRNIVSAVYLDAMDIDENVTRAQRWFETDNDDTRHWVGLDGDDIVGWACTFKQARDTDLDGAIGEVSACYALPRVWGAGVGYQMLSKALECLRDQGAQGAVLWVLEQNERAIGFYERQGFRADGSAKVEILTPENHLQEIRLRLNF